MHTAARCLAAIALGLTSAQRVTGMTLAHGGKFFWDYVTNFSNYLVPHPNLQVLAPNIRFFVQCHAKGIFEQGDSGNWAGDFVRLRAWLLAHLLWNPSLDDRRLTREFLGSRKAVSSHRQSKAWPGGRRSAEPSPDNGGALWTAAARRRFGAGTARSDGVSLTPMRTCGACHRTPHSDVAENLSSIGRPPTAGVRHGRLLTVRV